MKLFTRIFALALVLTMALTLAACGEDAPKASDPSDETTTLPTSGETTPSTEPDDGLVLYTVKVVDEAGNPIAGAYPQICQTIEGGSCNPIAMTDDTGIVSKRMAEDSYKVGFVMVPEGYVAEQEYYPLPDGEFEITITLKAA